VAGATQIQRNGFIDQQSQLLREKEQLSKLQAHTMERTFNWDTM
jgi:hypothetical protein